MLSRINCAGLATSALKRGVLASQARRMVPVLYSIAANATSATSAGAPTAPRTPVHDHSLHFKMERYFAAAMLPLFPAAYFIHGPVMDYALTAALVLHIHWGLVAVVEDYARPIVVGEKFAAIAPKTIYLLSAVLLAALLHFNYNDVGLTKAFEMVFAL